VATVAFTSHLKRYFPTLPDEVESGGETVGELVRGLEARWPGLGFYVTDEQGRLRRHVALFVDGRRVRDAKEPVRRGSVVQIFQALSGG
jgi:molybdopterin converting factor small subunit